MSESDDFLKYLFNEPIYVIEEATGRIDSPGAKVEPSTPEKDENVSEPLEGTNNAAEEHLPMKKEILILFDNPSGDHLSQTELDYLKKILGAINKTIDDIEFFNVAETEADVKGYKHILAFTPNHKLPIDKGTQQYMVVGMAGSQVIIADALQNISASTDLRKKLWEVLKLVFMN